MIKLIALLKRKPGLTREEFARRWLNDHVKLSSKMPGLRGYRVNIAIDHQPEGDGVEPPYDGTAELWWDSVQAMEDAFNSPEGKTAGEDADQFAQVRIHIYTEEHDVVPGPWKRLPVRRRVTTKGKAKTKRAR
jgi:uncharacterized protein (TIGR02118 family)